jgi:hypothetical protein
MASIRIYPHTLRLINRPFTLHITSHHFTSLHIASPSGAQARLRLLRAAAPMDPGQPPVVPVLLGSHSPQQPTAVAHVCWTPLCGESKASKALITEEEGAKGGNSSLGRLGFPHTWHKSYESSMCVSQPDWPGKFI